MPAFAAFVDATDLKQWAERRSAQETLPEILRRLVYATAPSATRVSFRAGEGVQLGGWDGLVTAQSATPFVPAGDSGWELGVDKGVRGKADDDFAARREGGGVIEPAESTFTFVTPRRFRDKVKWAADAKRDSNWNDVRAFDADDLATWLEQAPAVHAWVSAEIGKLPRGVRSLDEAWSSWEQGTVPAMPPGLAIAGRESDAAEVVGWLATQGTSHAIRGDTVEESLGFLASAVIGLPDDRRADAFARTVVVDDEDAWRELRRFGRSLILVPTFIPRDTGTAGGHTVILLVDKSSPASASVLTLGRIRREPADELLRGMGFDRDTAAELATLGRRSLPALRRRLASSPVGQMPPWAAPGPARSVLPALLAGRWREDHEGDRAILERLSGKSYREFAADIAPWFESEEPPMRRNGSVILATAPDETWDLLSRHITADDLQVFGQAVAGAFGEVDPRLALPRDERWFAAINGVARAQSDELREGIAETLVRMAAQSETVAGRPGNDVAAAIARTVLDDGVEDATGAAWISLGDVLPLLAEASPEAFLRSVDRGIEGEAPLFAALFPAEASDGFGSPMAEHVPLVWSLETLAWNPDHLARAALALARLAKLDPSGKNSPRPGESLARILHPLIPQTEANIETRLEVLKRVLEREPEVGFNVLIDLVPTTGGFLLPTHRPRRRASRSDRMTQVPYSEASAFIEAVVDELISRSGGDFSRWAEIVDLLFDLPAAVVVKVEDGLRTVSPEGPPDDPGRLQLVSALRSRAARLASRPDGETEGTTLAELVERFQCTDLAVSSAWLFAHAVRLPLPLAEDWKAHEADVQRRREEAILAVLDSQGFDGVQRLATASDVPWWVGHALAGVAEPEAVAGDILPFLLATEPEYRDLAAGWIARCFADRGWEWIESLDTDRSWTAEQWARLLMCLTPDPQVWDFAPSRGHDVAATYWRDAPIRMVPSGRTVIRAAGELLAAGRPHVALDLLAMLREELQPSDRELIYRTLEQASETPIDEAKDPPIQSYDVDRLLDVIENDAELDVERVAKIEWVYLPLVRHEERPAKVLHGELTKNAGFFAEVVNWVFKADAEPPRDLTNEERARARLGYELLGSWKQAPGVGDDEKLNAEMLRGWVLDARERVHAADRGDIGDQRIGQILRYTPRGDDGRWPAEPVRDLIEELGSEHIEIGLALEVRNSRGVTSRHLTAGGQQERELERKYREDAAAFIARWPRTAALMSDIADEYSREARREDVEASLTEDTWR